MRISRQGRYIREEIAEPELVASSRHINSFCYGVRRIASLGLDVAWNFPMLSVRGHIRLIVINLLFCFAYDW